MQRKLNPLANEINLPAMLSFGLHYGPQRNVQPTLNFQPRIPLGLGDEWRVVTRSNVPIVRIPPPDGSTGPGDADISFFLTPARTGKWVWGAGPVVQAPTATHPALGTGKWSAGPTGAVLYVDGPWVNGLLLNHRWSFAGQSGRDDVSLTQLEMQVSYTFASDWYVQTAPTLSYDWRAPSGRRWTVPAGLDVGKGFRIGSQVMSLQVGAYYSVKRPEGAADWVLQTQVSWSY